MEIILKLFIQVDPDKFQHSHRQCYHDQARPPTLNSPSHHTYKASLEGAICANWHKNTTEVPKMLTIEHSIQLKGFQRKLPKLR